MALELPLTSARLVEVQSVATGTLVHPANEHYYLRPLKQVIALGGGKLGIMHVDGDRPFTFAALGGSSLVDRVIARPTGELRIRVSTARPDEQNFQRAGTLFVAEDDAYILLHHQGIGGDVAYAYLSTSSWQVTKNQPGRYAHFTDWEMISHTPDGDEILWRVGAGAG